MVVFSVRNILRLHIYEKILNERLLDLFSFTRGRIGWISKIASFISESAFRQCAPKDFALPTHGCFYALRAYIYRAGNLYYKICPNERDGHPCHTHSYEDKFKVSRCLSCRYYRRVMPRSPRILFSDKISMCHLSNLENDSDNMKPIPILTNINKNKKSLLVGYRQSIGYLPVRFSVKNSLVKDFSFFVNIPIPISLWDYLYETNQIPHPAGVHRDMFDWKKNPEPYNTQILDVGFNPKDQIANVSELFNETLDQIVKVISDRADLTTSFLWQDGFKEYRPSVWTKEVPITPNASNSLILRAITKMSNKKLVTSYFAHAELPTCIQRRVERLFRTKSPRHIYTEINNKSKITKKFRLKVQREEDVRTQYIMEERERIDRHKRYLQEIFARTEKDRLRMARLLGPSLEDERLRQETNVMFDSIITTALYESDEEDQVNYEIIESEDLLNLYHEPKINSDSEG